MPTLSLGWKNPPPPDWLVNMLIIIFEIKVIKFVFGA
jgi:hypothetical protein